MAAPWEKYANQGPMIPGTGPKPPTNYGRPGAPRVAPIPGGPDDISTITAQERARAAVQAAKERQIAGFRSQLDLQSDAVKRQRDRGKPGGGAFDPATTLRKELEGLGSVKAYKQAMMAYGSALQAADNPAGDLNIVYAYAKMLDPDSVVRESEQAAVAGLGTIGESIVGNLRKQLDGSGRLPPALRRSIMSEMRSRGATYNQGYKAERKRYRNLAAKQGIDPSLVIGQHIGDAYAPLENKFWRGNPNLNAETLNRIRAKARAGKAPPKDDGWRIEAID